MERRHARRNARGVPARGVLCACGVATAERSETDAGFLDDDRGVRFTPAAALIAATDDPEPLVRAMSVRSLEAVTEFSPANRALQSRLSDQVRSVRIDAAWNLRQSVETNSPAGNSIVIAFNTSVDA